MNQIGNPIWVPSLERYVRFKEVTLNQTKLITKGTGSNIGILHNESACVFNSVLASNCLEAIDTTGFTTADRLAIFLRLKQISDSDKLSWIWQCPECLEDNKYPIKVNDIMKAIADPFGVNCDGSVEFNGLVVDYGLPTIHQEGMLHAFLISEKAVSEEGFSQWVNYNLAALFVRKIRIAHTVIDLNSADLIKRMEVINKLPIALNTKLLNEIVSRFLSPVTLPSKPCKTDSCEGHSVITFDILNTLPLLNNLFSIPINSYLTLARIVGKAGFDYTSFEQFTMGEVDLILKQLKEESEASNTKKPSPVTIGPHI